MTSKQLRVSDDLSAGGWVAPRLTGGFGTVTRTVPSGYAAYVRICHPPEDAADRLTTWSEVAHATGRRAHPPMQWHALVGSPDPLNMRGSLWPGSDPERGNLVPEVLGPLCDLLADHTATAEDCAFCLWDGYGWITDGSAAEILGRDEPSRPRLQLPGRDYLLFRGPLPAAQQIGWRLSADWFEPQSPNMFWPADRAWCVASEIDFDSTLVGGTPELVDAIRQSPAFDSWPVHSDDSLAAYADRINPVR
jgi:hypothetical protein